MKALIRNKDETVTECMKVFGIDWKTGAPLTNDSWSGGPYVLVENYDPTVCEVVSLADFVQNLGEDPVPETVTIDGVTYTRTP